MSGYPHHTAVSIDLSLEEQWVVHHVMLDTVGLAAADGDPEEPPQRVRRIVEKIEDGRTAFTPFELDHIRYACGAYIHDRETPERDRTHARAVIRRIDELLDDGESRSART